ncbi:MAG: DedA family protein [Paludibacteraceae bacterium]|nr:DedA family protein [Paludibacteraceae bacterium]
MKRISLTLTFFLAAFVVSAADVTWVDQVADWYGQHTNYASITALMAIESSFIPFPSEIIIPPAAYVASEGTAGISIIGVILFGTLGALIGAFINYFLALWLGRPIIYKFADSKVGHVLLLSGEKVQQAEAYFNKHGKISTLIGRLIPAVRQLISIPAGLAKMNIGAFALFTALGAGVWNGVLALLGYLAHGQKDLINQYSHELSVVLLGLLALLILYFVIRHVWKKKKTTN